MISTWRYLNCVTCEKPDAVLGAQPIPLCKWCGGELVELGAPKSVGGGLHKRSSSADEILKDSGLL